MKFRARLGKTNGGGIEESNVAAYGQRILARKRPGKAQGKVTTKFQIVGAPHARASRTPRFGTHEPTGAQQDVVRTTCGALFSPLVTRSHSVLISPHGPHLTFLDTTFGHCRSGGLAEEGHELDE